MSRATPQMRDLAERLIAHEGKESKSSGTKSPATFPVPERLRAPLASLVGNIGFVALLSRALVLAGQEVPWLRAVQVKADGSLDWPGALEAQVTPATIIDGRVALLAQLLGLLLALIGENLTMQLLREVWPKLVLKESYFAGREAYESKK